MIAFENVSKTYPANNRQPVVAVRQVDLRIPRGAFLVITGRSGSGKTTLLNLAAGLTRPSAGRVSFDDADWQALSDRRQSMVRNRKIGFVFQFPSLLPSLTVFENVILPEILGPGPAPGQSHERARTLLRSLALEDKMSAYPRQLSAGQQQRVVIARALINEPEVVLADEPTSDLDDRTEIEIMEVFRQLHSGMGITIVLVTHSTQLISYGSQSVRMMDGSIQPDASSNRSEPPPAKRVASRSPHDGGGK